MTSEKQSRLPGEHVIDRITAAFRGTENGKPITEGDAISLLKEARADLRTMHDYLRQTCQRMRDILARGDLLEAEPGGQANGFDLSALYGTLNTVLGEAAPTAAPMHTDACEWCGEYPTAVRRIAGRWLCESCQTDEEATAEEKGEQS